MKITRLNNIYLKLLLVGECAGANNCGFCKFILPDNTFTYYVSKLIFLFISKFRFSNLNEVLPLILLHTFMNKLHLIFVTDIFAHNKIRKYRIRFISISIFFYLCLSLFTDIILVWGRNPIKAI